VSLPEAPPVVAEVPEVPWRRLDRRMLLVHPVQELIRFFPALIGLFVVGSTGEPEWWQALGVAVPVLLGVVRFWTTRFRITPQQVELSRGLVSRKVLTARLDRVRAVAQTATPIHRVLGLAKVEISTGSGAKSEDDGFTLDALAVQEARSLRSALLHRTSHEPAEAETPSHDVAPHEPVHDQVLLRLDPGWVRFAPLTSSGNVIAAAILALLGQVANQVGLADVDEGDVEWLLHLGVAVLVVAAVAGFLVLGAIFSVLGYLVTNWGFTLSRDAAGRSFHVRRGLVTSSETSLERERVRGVEVREPLGLRLAGAARLSAIVTGLKDSEAGSTALVPPAPRTVVDGVGTSVLETADPFRLGLVAHGPRARQRRWTRALVGASVPAAVVLVLAALGHLPWWLLLPALLPLPVGAFLAIDRYRRLGHGLTGDHLVVRWGSLRGRRDVLQRGGIIGWNLHQSWFQRRAGLVTLVATTAAGRQAYEILDVPEPVAVALAAETVPGLVGQFLRSDA
jgi:putative membrane protein